MSVVIGCVHAAAGPPGERQADRQRDEAERAGEQQRLAHLRALHRIELRARGGGFRRALERADLDLDFADGLRRRRCRAWSARWRAPARSRCA